MSEELGPRSVTLYRRQQTKPFQKKRKKKSKRTKWLFEWALQIVEEQREDKNKGERERYIQLNVVSKDC